MPAAEGDRVQVVELIRAARGHAWRALEGWVEIERQPGMRKVGRGLGASLEARPADVEPPSPALELGVGLVYARRNVGDKHLDDDLLRMHGALAVARDFHARRRKAAARRR